MVTAGDAKGAPCPASSASRPEQSPGRVLAGMKDFRGPIITKINNVNKRIHIYIYTYVIKDTTSLYLPKISNPILFGNTPHGSRGSHRSPGGCKGLQLDLASL